MTNRQMAALSLLTVLTLTHCLAAQTIKWSGYDWQIRDDAGGPGPNSFNAQNISIDSAGRLHLRIGHAGKKWSCAEIYTTKAFGLGTYQFSVVGRVDTLDKNVVLGLFSYPEASVGTDGTNELDIEFGRWGNDAYPIGNYTAYPNRAGASSVAKTFDFHLNTADTTQRYTWRPHAVTFESLRGWHTGGNQYLIQKWNTPESFENAVAREPMPVHINLWLFHGRGPSDDEPVEMVIKAFKYTPPTK